MEAVLLDEQASHGIGQFFAYAADLLDPATEERDRDAKLAELNLALHPKQLVAFNSTATEILYGGAAYCGKSHMIRVAAITWAHMIPGLQVYIFRREFDDLYKNHIYGPSGFPAMLAPWISSGYAKFNDSKHIITIGGKSNIHLCHCQYEKSVYGYHGAEIHVLIPDELTQFTPFQYSYLRSRVRRGSLKLPERYRGLFPRILAATNPGNIGHNWVKAEFIDPKQALEIWRTPDAQGGMRRQFIPAKMEDNPSAALSTDENYEAKLEAIGDPALARAMRFGEWDIVAGGMFDDIWNSEVIMADGTKRRGHEVLVMPRFDIPRRWYIDRAHDWGDDKPFWTGWFAESNGETLEIAGEKRSWPPGHLFLIGEDYGWNGVPNQGIHLTAPEIARRGLEIEKELGISGRVNPGPGDIPDLVNGVSPRDQYARVGLSFTVPDKRPGSRVAGWQQLRQLMRASLKQPQEEPGLTFFDHCRQVLRVLPTLPRDEKKREDVNSNAEDHPGDGLRYRAAHRIYAVGTARITYG